MRWFWGAFAISAATLLDQATKFFILTNLAYREQVPVMPGFHLTLGFNHGMAFGMLNNPEMSRWIIIALTGLISLVLLVWMAREKSSTSCMALGLIVGGALGNLIDRLRHGRVTDFLDVYVGSYHWPTFNMADVAIFCGVAALLWRSYRSSRKPA